MSGPCALTYCRSGESAKIIVSEHAGDGCWDIKICKKCADLLNLKERSVIVDAHKTNEKLKNAYKKN